MNDATDSRHTIAGDRPLAEDGVDLLGFTTLAEQLASALINGTSSEGLVIGVQGKWGSGKSSFISLTTKALRSQGGDLAPSILLFRPWLIGNRDALLATLFSELATTVAAISLASGDATQATKQGLDTAANNLRTYGMRLGALAPVAQIAEVFGVPYAGYIKKFLDNMKTLGAKPAPKPLADVRKQLDKSMQALPKKIVVFVDDLDRLEPIEIAEMLRLVRSVADFSNVIYVLCYDEDVVAKAIQDTMKVSDGHSFMEKLVQVSVRIPATEPFALRKILLDGLSSFAGARTKDEAERLNAALNSVGHRLETVRAVNRVLDSVRFAWSALEGKVDFADYVWLQLVRATMPDLYKWTESYLGGVWVEATDRGIVSNEGKIRSSNELLQALKASGTSYEAFGQELREILPGIGTDPNSQTGNVPLYQTTPPHILAQLSVSKRLASPDHYRLYYALAVPSGAVLEKDYDQFWDAVDNGTVGEAADVLMTLFSQGDAAVRKAELLISRLKDQRKILTPDRASRIMLALANVMDDKAAIRDFDNIGGPVGWRDARDWFRNCKWVLGDAATHPTVAAFHHGQAIGWLTYLFRDETFAHGLYGEQPRSPQGWLLTGEEYDEIARTMRERYAALTDNELLSVPSLFQVLFAWSQPDHAEEVRQRVSQLISDDDNLVEYFEAAASLVSSTQGNYYHIPREMIEAFTKRDDVTERFERLSHGASHLADRAREILAMMRRARQW